MKDQIVNFLKKEKLFFADIDFETERKKFVNEMEDGLNGKGSLLMLPSFIDTQKKILLNTPVCAIDAGGTNLRFALVQFDEQDECKFLSEIRKMSMLGVRKSITKDDFFEKMAELMLPYLEKTDRVGISFAYETEITPALDGKILFLSKEVLIDDIDGAYLGKELKAALAKKGKRGVMLAVLNDASAVTLGGVSQSLGKKFDSYTGTIEGTGNNSCYIEKNSNIKKAFTADEKGSMIIDTECGNYDKFPLSPIDLEFQKTTAKFGEHNYEKMVSGKYLGWLTSFIIRKAAAEGILSKGLLNLQIDTIEMGCFLEHKQTIIDELIQNDDEREAVYEIMDTMVRRAAKLIAIEIAGLISKGRGKNICVTIEGSTYYKLLGLKASTERYLLLYADRAGIKITFNEIDNAVLKGCALLGAMI